MSKMKAFYTGQQLIYLSPYGPEVVQYRSLSWRLDCHQVYWSAGHRLFSADAADDELFPLDRAGLQSFVDAEIERRHAAALADMAEGNPTATTLIQTYEAITL